MTLPFDESEARAVLAPLRAMPPAVARRQGRGQLATRHVAIWPLLAVVALTVLLHPPLHHGDVTGTVVPGKTVPPTPTGPTINPAPPPKDGPCDVQAIIAQAYENASVQPGLSVACLRRAQQALTPDLLTYSNVDEIIRLAISRAELSRTPKPGG